jgi:hypothetical protein
LTRLLQNETLRHNLLGAVICPDPAMLLRERISGRWLELTKALPGPTSEPRRAVLLERLGCATKRGLYARTIGIAARANKR